MKSFLKRVSLLLFVPACGVAESVVPPPDATDISDAANDVTPGVAADAAPPETFPTSDYCKAQHLDARLKLFVCDELYDLPPFLRFPPDGAGTVIGSFDAKRKYGSLFDREGNEYTVPSPLFRGEANQSDRSSDFQGDTVYRASLNGTQVTGLERLVRIPDRHFMARWPGIVFEGLVSKKAAGASFETTPSIGIRMKALALVVAGQTQVQMEVENWGKSVRGADGKCLPDVSANAVSDRFSEKATFERWPSMHGPGMNHVALSFGTNSLSNASMVSALFVAPIELARAAPVLVGPWAAGPHGPPGTGPAFEIAPVQGGGGPCP